MPCCVESRDRAFYSIWIAYAQTSVPKEQELSLRNKIETSLDIILLRYLKGQLPIEFDMKQIFPKDEAGTA